MGLTSIVGLLKPNKMSLAVIATGNHFFSSM